MAHSIYADEMTATFKYGAPLWEPNSNTEVSIADVGYIRRGQFCRLFNASLPEGDPANQEFGEPDGYYPLHIGAIQELTPHPPGVMASHSVSKQGTSIGFNQSILQAGGSFNFSCDKNQGAILIINSEAYRKDALRAGAFKAYMMMRYKSWLRLANNERNARDISSNDLVFVTGRDLTADWAMAAFRERSLSGGVSFTAGYPIAGGAEFSIWGDWQQSSTMHSHCGPRIPRAHVSNAITESETQDESVNLCAADLNRYNQCIFLRGFRVMERTEYARRKFLIKSRTSSGGLDEVAKPFFARSSSSSELSDSSSSHTRRTSSEGSKSKKHSLMVNSPIQESGEPEDIMIMSSLFKERAPIDALLEYILEKSEAAHIAIAHDDDLAEILKEVQDDEGTVDFDRLIRIANVPVYVDSEGVGTVRECDVDNVLDTEDEGQKTTSSSLSVLNESGQSSPTMTPTVTPRARELELFIEKQRLKRASFVEEPAASKQATKATGSSTFNRKSAEAPYMATYRAEQERIRGEIDTLQATLASVQDRLSLAAKPGSGTDRRNALRAELDALRDQQQKERTDQDATSAELKTVEEETRKMIRNLQNITKKLPARTIEDLEAQIRTLERRIETGSMSLAEEKAAVRQTSNLHRSRPSIESSQALQADINAHRARADVLRRRICSRSVDTGLRMNAIREELNALRKDGDAAFARRGSLYNERGQLQAQLSKLYEQRRHSTERFEAEHEEHRRKINEERARLAAEARAERMMRDERRRIQAQERLLEKARAPAFAAEIRDCRSLLEYFSSTAKVPCPTTSSPPSPIAETTHKFRQPTDNHAEAWAGWVPIKKKSEDDAYFTGAKGKGKSKKSGRRGTAPATSGSAKISVPIGVLSNLVTLSVDPPMVAADVSRTIDELHQKLQWYEANQAPATAENVARAKAELERVKNPVLSPAG